MGSPIPLPPDGATQAPGSSWGWESPPFLGKPPRTSGYLLPLLLSQAGAHGPLEEVEEQMISLPPRRDPGGTRGAPALQAEGLALPPHSPTAVGQP